MGGKWTFYSIPGDEDDRLTIAVAVDIVYTHLVYIPVHTPQDSFVE